MAHHAQPPGGHQPELAPASPREITDDVLGRLLVTSPRYWTAVAVLAALFLLGVVGFALRVAGGFGDRAAWGYYAAFFPFLLSSALAAPIVAWTTRAAKGHWGRTLRRPAELVAIAAILALLWFIPLLALIPPFRDAQGHVRLNIWGDWPLGAPHTWDFLAVLGLVVLGLAVLYVGALPDIAAARDRTPAGRRWLFAALAPGWRGTPRQWRTVQHGVVLLGALYMVHFVFTQYLVAVDLSESLVPGWFSAIYPVYNAVTGLSGAVATTLLTIGLLRWLGGYRSYLGLDQFWALAKLQLPLGLFWFYFFWSEFIVMWYGRTPREQKVAELVIFGPYFAAFVVGVAGLFLTPFLALIWNRVRVSIVGPFVVSIGVLTGLFFDRLRLYVSAFSVENPFVFELERVPPTHYPGLPDVLLLIGGLAAVPLLVLLALRVVPAISLWEVKEGLVLGQARPYMATRVRIIGKPR